MKVRTRFAPSPTGYLHIGGVRTALFNWLFTRKHGGQFILRIDDTDAHRNVAEALEPILAGFDWLGIDWDEGPRVGGPHGPYFQSQRADLYAAAVQQLLESAAAYRDYATPDEVKEEREAAQKSGKSFTYSRRWMAQTSADDERFQGEGRTAVVRMKTPREGVCRVNDLVLGEKEFAWENEQDTVIARADGSCLYHLASVVDDHAMDITHVIRSQEHFSNTPRQIFIAQSLGYEIPQFAHLPYVAEPGSKKKLSKRSIAKYLKNHDFKKIYDHGAAIAEQTGKEVSPDTFNPVLVDFYRDTGYLADAIVNYLLLVGWSLDGETEDFTRQEMIDQFSLERVVTGAASFDPQKLVAFEHRRFNDLPLKQKTAMCLGYLKAAGHVADPTPCEIGPYLTRLVEETADRLVTAGDIFNFLDFFTPDEELPYDEKTMQKRLRKPEGAVELLRGFREKLAAAESFASEDLQAMSEAFAEEQGVKLGLLNNAVRIAVTGKNAGIGTYQTLSMLGKDRCLKRIDQALEKV